MLKIDWGQKKLSKITQQNLVNKIAVKNFCSYNIFSQRKFLSKGLFGSKMFQVRKDFFVKEISGGTLKLCQTQHQNKKGLSYFAALEDESKKILITQQ